MKGKLGIIVLVSVLCIALVASVAYILWNNMHTEEKSTNQHEVTETLTAAERKEMSVDINDILTNNADSIVKASFTFELNNMGAKEEFQLLDFKVKNAIIETIADMETSSLQGSKGYDNLTSILMQKVNEFLVEGKVNAISITNIVMQ